ncbi:MAG TPA: valine--pyruvate transaminase [Terrimicrobiaceae bacterium]
MFEKSLFGERLASGSGIEELMDDLGRALAGAHGRVRMLGGGNPAHIPEMQAIWRNRMAAILADPPAFDRMLTNYDPPIGNPKFIVALANLLREEFGWNVGPENIAITAGGQTAFFFLFNLLAGEFRDGRRKTILLPLVPEYIGYMNQGLASGHLHALEPRIEFLPGHRFKYHVDFERLNVSSDVAALCVSRPTNPSGNVLTNNEIHRLAAICRGAGVPLIIDNAYGVPFPGILFREADPIWDENIILTLSLSKLGLPNTRTGIVVAHPEIIRAIASMTAIVGLANCSIGQAIVLPLVKSGDILRLAREVIQPFYERKSHLAQEWVAEFFDNGLDYHVHVSEGALFLWLWFRGMKISAETLYSRLKARGVLIVPGHYFGVGGEENWKHGHECIRLSFAMDETSVREGIAILAEEVAKGYR